MRLVASRTIEHDGRRYEAGETLDVPDAAAAALLACGAAEMAVAAPAEAGAESGPAGPAIGPALTPEQRPRRRRAAAP